MRIVLNPYCSVRYVRINCIVIYTIHVIQKTTVIRTFYVSKVRTTYYVFKVSNSYKYCIESKYDCVYTSTCTYRLTSIEAKY